MQKRRTSGILVAVMVALTVVALVRSAATGRLSALSRTWGPVASSLAASAWSALDPVPSSSAPAPGDANTRTAEALDAAVAVHRQAAPLSSAQLGAPLVHGSFVGACGAPDDMKVVVNVTVKMGRAVHVTATTQPSDPVVASCIERAARDLQWDISPKTDHVTVRY